MSSTIAPDLVLEDFLKNTPPGQLSLNSVKTVLTNHSTISSWSVLFYP